MDNSNILNAIGRTSRSRLLSLSPQAGTFYFETLIALAIVAVTLVAFLKYQFAVQVEDNALYLQSVAQVQMEAMIERLHANAFCVACEVVRWNASNARVLPYAQGNVSGNYPYHIELRWKEPSGKSKQIIKDVWM